MSEANVPESAVAAAEAKLESEERGARRAKAIDAAKSAAAAQAEAERVVAERDAKVRAESDAKRAKSFKAFAKSIGDYMVASGVENPRVIDDAVVERLRAEAGL